MSQMVDKPLICLEHLCIGEWRCEVTSICQVSVAGISCGKPPMCSCQQPRGSVFCTVALNQPYQNVEGILLFLLEVNRSRFVSLYGITLLMVINNVRIWFDEICVHISW